MKLRSTSLCLSVRSEQILQPGTCHTKCILQSPLLLLGGFDVGAVIAAEFVFPSLCFPSLSRRNLLVPSAKTLVAAKSSNQGTATVAETLLSSPWGQCANRDDQRCYSDRRSSPVAGCSSVPSVLWCSLEALHTASPHKPSKSWVYWLMCLSGMLPPPSLRKQTLVCTKTNVHPSPYWFRMMNASCCSKLLKSFFIFSPGISVAAPLQQMLCVDLLFSPPGWRWANPWEKAALGKWSWLKRWGLTRTGQRRQWPWQWRCWKVRKLGD